MKNIGSTAQFSSFSKRSHNWGDRMNDQIVKMAVALHGSCIAFVDALPAENMQEGDTYVLTTTKRIYVWVNEILIDTIGPVIQPAQWYEMFPAPGFLILDRQAMIYYVFANGQWVLAWNVGAQHRVVQRELTFYNPYRVRPNSTLFLYCAGTELTLPDGVPGSGATLEVAPSGNLSLSILHNGAPIGSVFFAAGQTTGSVNVNGRRVIHPSIDDNKYVSAHTLSVVSPADTKSAEGLSMSIKGEIRSIDQ